MTGTKSGADAEVVSGARCRLVRRVTPLIPLPSGKICAGRDVEEIEESGLETGMGIKESGS